MKIEELWEKASNAYNMVRSIVDGEIDCTYDVIDEHISFCNRRGLNRMARLDLDLQEDLVGYSWDDDLVDDADNTIYCLMFGSREVERFAYEDRSGLENILKLMRKVFNVETDVRQLLSDKANEMLDRSPDYIVVADLTSCEYKTYIGKQSEYNLADISATIDDLEEFLLSEYSEYEG